MSGAIERGSPALLRLRLRRRAAFLGRALLPLVGALAAACASAPAPTPASPRPVRVRIGAVGPIAVDASGRPPASLPERIEQLVDLFWQRGCVGGDLSRPRAEYARYPDVVCRLPGRTRDSVVVAAYLEGPSEERAGWPASLLLPHLYAALGVEEREHSFVFAAFARRSPGGLREDARRLAEARDDRVRAVTDLDQLLGGASALRLVPGDPESFRAAVRTLAVSLGYLDATLGRSGESPRAEAGGG